MSWLFPYNTKITRSDTCMLFFGKHDYENKFILNHDSFQSLESDCCLKTSRKQEDGLIVAQSAALRYDVICHCLKPQSTNFNKPSKIIFSTNNFNTPKYPILANRGKYETVKVGLNGGHVVIRILFSRFLRLTFPLISIIIAIIFQLARIFHLRFESSNEVV